jgi:transposase
MKETEALSLDSRRIGALPIINSVLAQIGLGSLLDEYVVSRRNQKLSHAQTIELLVRNILIEREPLYKLSEWSAGFDSTLVGLQQTSPSALNDDRVGRSLDALFDADRASLMTRIVLKAVDEFDIDLHQCHNDSTTVTVHGQYARGRSKHHRKTSVALTHGHNKDHRPDLKQLLFTLTVSRDAAVPIHYKSYDGNTTDDTTHIQAWEALRRLTGRSDFIYVADSKLCTREQMTYLAKEGGKFITVMPQTRKECAWFYDWYHTHGVQWTGLLKRPDPRKPGTGVQKYWGYESPLPSQEGYRIIWILSSQKREQDANNRQRRIEKTIHALDTLKQRVGARRLKTKEQIAEAVSAVFEKHHSAAWFEWKIVSEHTTEYKQKGLGRPGKHTEYVKTIKERWTFEAMPNGSRIQQAAERDGMFTLMTNIPPEQLSTRGVLLKYKFQPYIEKRHQQFKSVFNAAPVFLKTPHRIEALLFIYFIVLLLNALIERELRRSMKCQNIRTLPLYPEHRKCRFPTTTRILELFSNQSRHVLIDDGKVVKCFYDDLSSIQDTVLQLLGVSDGYYHTG